MCISYTTISLPYLSVKGATDMTSSQDDFFRSDQSLNARQPSVRKKRKDAGHIHWQNRDYSALEGISAQGVVRFNQFERFFGDGTFSE